MTGLGGIVGAG